MTLGNSALTLSSPLDLHEFSLGLSPEIMDRIEFLKSYRSDEDQPIQIAVNIEKIKPPLKANLQGAVHGAVTEAMNKPDISDFIYADSQVIVSNIPAILQSGSYLSQKKYRINFKDLFISRKRTLWQITILFKASDPSGKEIADSIIHSVSIH